MKIDFTEITAGYKALTPKAVLLNNGTEEKWVPVSCLGIREQMKVDAREYRRNETYTFKIMTWWTQKEGW